MIEKTNSQEADIVVVQIKDSFASPIIYSKQGINTYKRIVLPGMYKVGIEEEPIQYKELREIQNNPNYKEIKEL